MKELMAADFPRDEYLERFQRTQALANIGRSLLYACARRLVFCIGQCKELRRMGQHGSTEDG